MTTASPSPGFYPRPRVERIGVLGVATTLIAMAAIIAVTVAPWVAALILTVE